MGCTHEPPSTRPAAEEVAPGVWSIRQPLKNAMRYVWAYAMEVEDGVLLVDAGLDDDEHFGNLEAGLGMFGAALDDVRGAIFTHYHGDHYGLAERIRTHSGAWLALHEVEAELIATTGGRPVVRDDVDRWFGALGVSEDHRQDLVDIAVSLETRNRSRATPDRVLSDGDMIEVSGERLEIVHTPGHSPGHVCIVDRRREIVFSGDHVLSETTPNVSIFPGTAGSPLDDYLGALARVLSLDDLLALPGHEDRVRLGARGSELIDYHADQLELVGNLVADGRATVPDVAGGLWPLSWRGLRPIDRHLALGEAYAHLHVLERRGDIYRIAGKTLRWRVRQA